MKVIAGPRWTPGYPGRNEFEASSEGGDKSDSSKDGWIKISEERFPDARTNRWNVGSMLEKLVEAANVSSSTRSGI
jgi:small subunit ribosomal protein S35